MSFEKVFEHPSRTRSPVKDAYHIFFSSNWYLRLNSRFWSSLTLLNKSICRAVEIIFYTCLPCPLSLKAGKNSLLVMWQIIHGCKMDYLHNFENICYGYSLQRYVIFLISVCSLHSTSGSSKNMLWSDIFVICKAKVRSKGDLRMLWRYCARTVHLIRKLFTRRS